MNDLILSFQVGIIELCLSDQTQNPEILSSTTRKQNLLALTRMGYCRHVVPLLRTMTALISEVS